MELLDEEVTKMKMCMVGETKQLQHFAWSLIQVLFPCPTSLIFFLPYDFTVMKFIVTFQIISKFFLDTLFHGTNNQPKQLLDSREMWSFLYGTKGAEFYCKAVSQKEC